MSANDGTEYPGMSKASHSFPRPLSEFMGATLSDALKTQGFASAEILARWGDIVGPEVAAHSEPMKIAWPRAVGEEAAKPATLVLRVEGPAAIEIQHLSAVILEGSTASSAGRRSAASRCARRRCAASRARRRRRPIGRPPASPKGCLRSRTDLRQALARLGAAIKRK